MLLAQAQVAPPAVKPALEPAGCRRQMEESIARQKESIRKQTGAASSDSFFTVGWTSAPMIAPMAEAPDCPPLGDTDSAPLIKAAATANKLDPALIRALIQQESGFYPCAVSPMGAMGLMQLMPETAERFHVTDPFNSKENVRAGTQYLKQLMEYFKGDLRLALAAYNAGVGKVDGNPPSVPEIPETQDYVNAIMQALAGASPEAEPKPK
jgi:soluble lytic murein transglycosylase-like protein